VADIFDLSDSDLSGAPAMNLEGGPETTGCVFDIKRYAIHDGPGIRTTVFLKGCPLRCLWCHNPESWRTAREPGLRRARCVRCGRCVEVCPENAVSITDGEFPETDPEKCTLCGECIETCPANAREIIGSEMTAADVFAEVERDRVFYEESGGGVTFSGGEPLAQPEFLLAALGLCRDSRIHTAVDTTCYVQPNILDAVAERADLFLCDIKHMDSELHERFTGAPNMLILDNIRRLAEAEKQIIIRIPIIPGYNEGSQNIEATGGFAASLPGLIRIDILPYNRGGSEKAGRLAPGIDIMQTETPDDRKMNEIARRLGSHGLEVKIGG